MIKKIPNQALLIFFFFFALKKCRILHIEYLTRNKKNGYHAFNKYSGDKLIIVCIFEK